MLTPSFQAKLLDPHTLRPQPINPQNGHCFELPELYQLLDCTLVDVVRLGDDLILIIDDEGKFRHPCYHNLIASSCWYRFNPAARGVDFIAGRAVLCHTSQFE